MALLMTQAQAPDAQPDAAAQRPWLDATAVQQRSAAALASGLTRESWKYTPLAGFLEALEQASADQLPSLHGIGQPGVTATALTELDDGQRDWLRRAIAHDLNPERHPLADLVLLRAGAGWLLDIASPLASPIEIEQPATGLSVVFLRLRPQADAVVVEHLAARGFQAQVLHAGLDAGARLQHHRAALDRDVGHYALLGVHLARDASYRLNQTLLGGRRRRADIHVTVADRGAEVDLAGAYLVEDGQHLDQQLIVEHRAGHSTSRQKFHGIGAGKGRSVFNGRIHIHPNAPQTDASLSNRNLALHPDAEMNTKPELEIYTDDVRCAHGATVGQLAADSLFYLTARGIPEATARRLLSHGFVRECLEGPLSESSTARLLEALS